MQREHTPDSFVRALRGSRRLLAALGCLLLAALVTPSTAAAQGCSGEAKFVIRGDYFRYGGFGRGPGQGSFGPVEDSFDNLFTFPGSVSTKLVESDIDIGASGGVLSVDIRNRSFLRALRTAGNDWGGGFDLWIDVYVKGGPGTPYFLDQNLGGQVSAQHPAGAGTTHGQILGTTAVVNNGGSTVTLPVSRNTMSTGVTGSQQHPSCSDYTLAATVSLSTWCFTWQTIDICFFGCGPFNYEGISDLSGTITAGCPGGCGPQLPDVALVAGDTSGLNGCQFDVQSYLLGTGRFASVDVIDAVTRTPILAELEPYDAVLTWSFLPYQDGDALGDVLADYIDCGGAVVSGVYANTSANADESLGGRWLADGFEIIQTQLGTLTDGASLGTVLDPGHPTMSGVSTLNASSAPRPIVSAPLLQGTLIAEWNDGAPLVAVGNTPGRVDLGLYPPSGNCGAGLWDLGSNDGETLVANALYFAISTARDSVGTNYCTAAPNSTGLPGVICASGSSTASANDLVVRATQLPLNQFGIFITSQAQDFLPGTNGMSDGNLCLGGQINRFVGPGQILSSGPSGGFSLALDLTNFPDGGGSTTVVAGQTRNFQAWHRDASPLGSNLTDGLEILFD